MVSWQKNPGFSCLNCGGETEYMIDLGFSGICTNCAEEIGDALSEIQDKELEDFEKEDLSD